MNLDRNLRTISQIRLLPTVASKSSDRLTAPMDMSIRDQNLCSEFTGDYSSLRAVYINCTLKKSPEMSQTQGLMDRSIAVMEANGVTVERFRAVDFDIPVGVYPDMTEHGWEDDQWPELYAAVKSANILVLGTPIWLGEKSSIATKTIERLYGESGTLNDQGQYAYYGKAGGCLVTGNEDGIKHCAMGILYALQHLGYTIPPRRPTPAGSAKRGPVRPIWTPPAAGWTTTSPTATPPS